jgi:tetratricopeptide (TPR) repeat protein
MYKLAAVVGGLFLSSALFAQTGVASDSKYGHGADSIECVRNLSLYQHHYKNRDYNSAIGHWRFVFNNCPKSSVNNISRGISMYQYFIARELDPSVKSALVDTLMMIYKEGIQLLPQKKGEYMAAMAQDMQTYLEDSPETKKKILKTTEESIIAEQENTLPVTFVNYMKTSLDLNNAGTLTDEELLDNYTKVSEWLDVAITKTSHEDLAKARDVIDNDFAQSLAANCENLIKIYSDKFEGNKNDLTFLKKLTHLLNRKDCTDTKLFEQASEKQFELDPSAQAAYNMAKLFLQKENFLKAIEYLDNAIEQETNPVKQATYWCQKGDILRSKLHKFADAKKCALEAAKLRPDWGEPYLLLATIYAQGPSCGEDEFEKRQIYWVIVDKLTKAKQVDPEYAERVNSSINDYSKHFPSKEEGFFRDITEGSIVTVGCWVNENTRARY